MPGPLTYFCYPIGPMLLGKTWVQRALTLIFSVIQLLYEICILSIPVTQTKRQHPNSTLDHTVEDRNRSQREHLLTYQVPKQHYKFS